MGRGKGSDTSGPKYTAHGDPSLKPLTAGTRPFRKVMETSLKLSVERLKKRKEGDGRRKTFKHLIK